MPTSNSHNQEEPEKKFSEQPAQTYVPPKKK